MMARLRIVIFTRRATSVTTANWVMSAPVPAVLGAQTMGGMGWVILLQPS